ncbi:MAG: Antitoxin [Deltaproteobacteria bacterium]|nr:Antitoxin [Deltaproteobacteria bacterium]
MTMNTVNVATLKEKLSYYLGLVKKGQEVVVTSHRHPVARILPSDAPTVRILEPTRQVKDLLKIKGVKRRRSVSAVETLLSDRRRR